MAEETKDKEVKEEEVEKTTAEEVDKTEKKTQQNDDVNEQKMIPYWRFKEVVDEKNNLQNKLNELQDKIENMEDPEEIKKQFKQENEKLEERNKNFLKISEVKVKAIAEGIRKEALEDFIKAKSDDIKSLEVENDNVKGVDELIKDAKENKPFYFSQDESKTKTAGDFTGEEKGEESDKAWAKKMADKFTKY